jgi:hypothetical protein
MVFKVFLIFMALQLRRLPGLEWVVRRFLRVVEEAVYLDNIGSAVLVGECSNTK